MNKDTILYYIYSIIVVFIAMFAVLLLLSVYDSVKTDALYQQAKVEIYDEIESDMSKSEINDIIKVSCERYMTTQSDEYYCIKKYKSEN